MVKLTDKEKKKIIADYINCQNYSETGRKNGVSRTTVRKLVKSDPGSCEKLQQKRDENTLEVLEYFQQQHEIKKRTLVKLLEAMEKKAETVDMFTNIRDLATAYGIILDKEFKHIELQKNTSGASEPIEIIFRRE